MSVVLDTAEALEPLGGALVHYAPMQANSVHTIAGNLGGDVISMLSHAKGVLSLLSAVSGLTVLYNFARMNRNGVHLGLVVEMIYVHFYVPEEGFAIPKADLAAMLFALAYAALVFDLIPDFVPFVGFLDDIYVLSAVMSVMADNTERYAKHRSPDTIRAVAFAVGGAN